LFFGRYSAAYGPLLLSGNALTSVNVIALRQTRLVPG